MYHLHLLRCPPGTDPLAEAERSYAAGYLADSETPDAEAEARKERVVDQLLGWDYHLTAFAFEGNDLWKGAPPPRPGELRRRDWLCTPSTTSFRGAGDSGASILIRDCSGYLRVPLWCERSPSRVWDEVWDYLRVLEREGGYTTYDPRLHQIVDLDTDQEHVIDSYREQNAIAAREVEENERAEREERLECFRHRRQRFNALIERIGERQPDLLRDFNRVTCPACGHPTLHGDKYEMCVLCEWEDDYQDDPHADEVWGGPNAEYSLAEARSNFEQCDGRGGMYRPEHERDFQRVENRYPRNQQLMEAYDQLLEAETLEELKSEIVNVREVEGWPDWRERRRFK